MLRNVSICIQSENLAFVSLCLNLSAKNAWEGQAPSQGYYYFCTVLSYSILKIPNQQMLFTFKTGQSPANHIRKINIWRITEFNQITPIWVHLCHVLSFSSSWLCAQGYRQTLQYADLTSLLNSLSSCFQIFKLSRRTQICVFLTWTQVHRCHPVVTYRGRCWPREFQQCLFMFVYPSLPPKMLKAYCIYNSKSYTAASRFYSIIVLL